MTAAVGATPADLPSRTPRWFRRLAGDRARERTFRVLALGYLPAGVLFGLLAAPLAVGQASIWPVWWSIAAFALGVGPSIVLGTSAFVLPLPALRVLAIVNVVCPLVLQASMPLVQRRPLDGQAWFLAIGGLGLISAGLAFPAGRAVLALLLGAALTMLDRVTGDPTNGWLEGVQDGLYVLLFTTTFVALGVSALRTASAADRAEEGALAAAQDAAARQARDRERARINALVHDRVLATLLTAARRVPGSEDLGRADAARALAGLQALLLDAPEAVDVDGETFVWQVQAVVTELAPEAVFNFAVHAERLVPGPVAEALLHATEEALRNSLRHAGPAARTVHVEVHARAVCVDVLDDGVGFDPAEVAPARLGIADSIEGRLRTLPGGSARIVAEPGVGTRVVLRWSP